MDIKNIFSFLLPFVIVGLVKCRYAVQEIQAAQNSTGFVSVDNWDLLTLSMQWPNTYCRTQKCFNKPADVIWTIHGLWPGYINSNQCPPCEKLPYDNSIENLNSITKLWPNLKMPGNSFWKYEWSKHGACATSLQETANCKKYFEKTLNLAKEHDVNVALKDCNIQPSSGQLSTKNVALCLKNKLQVGVRLRCYKQGNEALLGEIHICFTKQFKLMTCPGSETCDDDSTIRLGDLKAYSPCPECLVYPNS